jgi:cold shock CspA family protein
MAAQLWRSNLPKTSGGDRLEGTVALWEQSHGFINGDDGGSYYVSRNDLPRGVHELAAGQRVAFTGSRAPEPGRRWLRARAVALLAGQAAALNWPPVEEPEPLPPGPFAAGSSFPVLDTPELPSPGPSRPRRAAKLAVTRPVPEPGEVTVTWTADARCGRCGYLRRKRKPYCVEVHGDEA